jgi:poly-beta-1,6-N-acetyl-D-glucosamine synthase
VTDFLLSLGQYNLIVISILIFSLLIQLIYYLIIYIRVSLFKSSKKAYTKIQEPVSILICAKNESENLANHLPSILEQDYPCYEVIVVNDCSDDDTQQVLEKLQEKYPHLKTTLIKHDEKFTHGKKLALTVGIKAAVNEWLLLTDADCMPASNQWLSAMQKNFTENTDIVLGYGGYITKKGFINRLIRFDTFFIALQYLSYALIKVPYMGVGRNLAYRKSFFLKNKGFASHAHILSGDDDLFVNELARGKNTRVEFKATAHTRSVPKYTFQQWLFQKKRHFSTSNRYKFGHKILLGTEVFSRLWFYASVIYLIVNPQTIYIGLSAFIFRLIIQLIIFNTAMGKLKEKKILLFSVLFDIILPLINIFLYLVQAFNSKHYRWK